MPDDRVILWVNVQRPGRPAIGRQFEGAKLAECRVLASAWLAILDLDEEVAF